jgi:hypothetical protein
MGILYVSEGIEFSICLFYKIKKRRTKTNEVSAKTSKVSSREGREERERHIIFDMSILGKKGKRKEIKKKQRNKRKNKK